MTIALHACCGPCLIEPLESFGLKDDVVVVFANPNIAPAEEYLLRWDTLLAYTASMNVRVVELAYSPDLWREAVAGLEDHPSARCAACYRLRLGMTAQWAAEHGIGTVATTLTVSPYQDPSAIRVAGETVTALAGIEYLHRDFRDRYPSAALRSRELAMYRQNYCGCAYSKREAEEAREARRLERHTSRRAEGERSAAPAVAAVRPGASADG